MAIVLPLVILPNVTAAYASASASRLSYIISPHPDDEYAAWSQIQRSPDNYPVFVYITQGQSIKACETAQQGESSGDGPYRYEGPYNPVANPNNGEMYPGNLYGQNDPWQGTGSSQCKLARMNSTVQFISDMALHVDGGDPTVPALPVESVPNKVCFGPTSGGGNGFGKAEPNGKDACASYWDNNVGAAIFFDLGSPTDQNVQPNDVAWAVEMVNEGIQAGVFYDRYTGYSIPNLPVGNILSSAFYNAYDPSNPSLPGYQDPNNVSGRPGPQYGTTKAGVPCNGNNEPAHWAVAYTVWYKQMIPNTAVYGRTCSGDPTAVRNMSVDQGIEGQPGFGSGVFAWKCLTAGCDPQSENGSWGAPLGASTTDYGWLDPGANWIGVWVKDASSGLSADSGWSDLTCSDINNQGGYGNLSSGPGGASEDLGSCNQAFWRGMWSGNAETAYQANAYYDFYSPESYDRNV